MNPVRVSTATRSLMITTDADHPTVDGRLLYSVVSVLYN
jgi:hypothetical protein